MSYIGDTVDGKMHGQGTFRVPGGSEYTGIWEDNKMHGQGTFRCSNDDEYTGLWKDGNMHCNIVHTTSAGETFDEVYVEGVFQSSAKRVVSICLLI